MSSKEQSEPACKKTIASKGCGMLERIAAVIQDLDKNPEKKIIVSISSPTFFLFDLLDFLSALFKLHLEFLSIF